MNHLTEEVLLECSEEYVGIKRSLEVLEDVIVVEREGEKTADKENEMEDSLEVEKREGSSASGFENGIEEYLQREREDNTESEKIRNSHYID